MFGLEVFVVMLTTRLLLPLGLLMLLGESIRRRDGRYWAH
jgi:hypothetical protein